MYQRSADVFLGVPFNIAEYALLTHMVAQVCALEARELILTFGDVHLYRNHHEQAREQLEREPKPLPRLRLDPAVTSLDAFRYQHVAVEGYHPHPAIAAQVAV
jgi:thymidylate synthase